MRSPSPPEPIAAVRLPSDAAHLRLIVRDRRGYAAAKRAFDVVFALLLLVVTLPVWAIVALLIRLTSRGPTIFGQMRCGRDGRPFRLYKFRTMVDGADRMQHELRRLNDMSGPVFKLRNDPRVTPVGRWLRRASIDELPQLINVLRGEMSVVGPRPPMVTEVMQYGPREWGRLTVKPGLTCLWQVSGRSFIDFPEWVALDLEYVRRRSFWLDLLLVARTIPAVLTGRGAH